MKAKNLPVAGPLLKSNFDINEISQSYFIQLVEEKRRADKVNPLKLQYYFDSYDMINLIEGGLAYVTNMGYFDRNKYRKDRLQNLVYAFAFQKLYHPPIKMLEPHKVEFFNIIYNHSYNLKSPMNKEDNKDILEEIFYQPSEDGPFIFDSASKQEINDKVYDLIEKSPEILRINFLIRDYMSWKKRLKFLQSEKIITLDEVNNELKEIEDTDLFQLINAGFEEARPGGMNNNFYDSLAFYHLQKMLENFNDNPNQELPVFFSSTPVVRKAVEYIRSENPTLFSYELQTEDNKAPQRIPIVRDSLFFVLEPIFTIDDRTESFFNELKESRPLIRAIIDEEYRSIFDQGEGAGLNQNFKKAKRKFENNIKEIVEVKLTQEIWLKQKAYEGLIEQVKEMISWSDEDLEAFEKEIDKQLTGILQNAKNSLERSRHLSAIIRAFRTVEKDVDIILRQNSIVADLDIFRDFALIKFGIDKRKIPQLDNLTEALINDNLEGTTPAIYNILSSLSTKINSPRKAERFLQGIAVAWILRKYTLITELCSQISNTDIQNRYETALIYAASIINIKRNRKGIEETIDIIRCVLEKNELNYKVWIGVAYIYYRIWEVVNNKYRETPEMSPKYWDTLFKDDDYQQYITDGAIHYIKKSLTYLKDHLEDELDEYGANPYLPYYLYALNNYIYYTTKSGTKSQFELLQSYINELKDYELHHAEWQGRFYDTMGWYTLRMSFYNKEFKSIYLNQAEKYLEKAKKHIASPRDWIMYQQLEDAILQVRIG